MIKKTELLVAPKQLAEIELLAVAGADAFVVGDARFALCGHSSVQESHLLEAISSAHARRKRLYLLADALMPNALLTEFAVYLQQVKHLPFDGIRVADIGAYWLVREIIPTVAVHLVDAMMLTNYETVNYWATKGVKRVRLAHELTYDEVLAIKSAATPEVEVLIQGAPLMFTSRRQLLNNYLTYQRP